MNLFGHFYEPGRVPEVRNDLVNALKLLVPIYHEETDLGRRDVA